MEQIEEWINCIEGEDYEISNFGNCRRKMKNGTYKIIGGSILTCGTGYKYFQMKRDGKRINYLFHHLVAKCFIGERPDGLVVDHVDRNSLNNNVINLRYVTQKENCKNTDKYITDIEEDDVIIRHKIVCKKYREEHEDELKENKKKYYEENKEKINEKEKNKKHQIMCSICDEERIVSHSQYNAILRKNGIEGNICRICQSKINLNIT